MYWISFSFKLVKFSPLFHILIFVISKLSLSDLIREKGLAYDCGENGCMFSGGEKQHISIARCLTRKPSILIMDEGTSVLDAMSDYGIRLASFYVNEISIPEDDPAVKKIKDALAKKAEMNIIGYSYQQERSFDTMESAVKNESMGAAPFMGAGMGIGMGVGVGGAMAGTMGTIFISLVAY